MPGSHFSSKRLRKALQTKSDPRMAGTVSRVGTPLATIRLLPRVEKHCGCSVRAPPLITTVITVTAPYQPVVLVSLNKMRDDYDYNGTGGTVGFIHHYNVAVGDTISFTDNGGVAYTGTVTAVEATKGAPNRNNEITLTPAVTNAGYPQGGDITLTQP